MASSAGALDQASADYAAVLAASPNNAVVAAQALNHGVRAGDWRLALDAANALERQRALLPDARFVLLAEELRARDWAAAGAQIDAVERDRVFTLAVPVLRAWLAFASQRGDPLAALAPASAEPAQGPAAGYAAEHRALLMLAMGRPEGAGEMLRAARSAGPRGARLKIAGASLLARRGDKAGALALLDGDGTALAAARALVEAGRPVPGAIADANAGVAELMIRLAVDLNAQDLAQIGRAHV